MSHSEIECVDLINCCSKSIHDCGNIKSHGYNCFGLDANGYNQPCGVIVQKKLDHLIKEQKIGPCKCLSIDEPCTCGIFLVIQDEFDTESKTIYLSHFTEMIQTYAYEHHHHQSKYALDNGTEIHYNIP